MNRFTKRVFCIAAALMLCVVCLCPAASAAEGGTETQLTILCSNVGGLPIPMLFSPGHKFVPRTQAVLGRMLNESGADIVCVQEDFQYHDLLANQMTSYPYSTFTSGGIPAGDGMNIFSKYPIYNVDRVAWDAFNGILKYDNDGLTPKGFMRCTVDVDGVLVDLYNIHTDASRALEDQLAKKAQFLQLLSYIAAQPQDRPVLITGDMNCTLHTYYYAELYETMIAQAGYRDGWAEVVNGGDYLRGENAQELIDAYNARYDGKFWGRWDSYERLLYRDGGGAAVTATDFRYDFYTDRPDKPEALTDHAVMRCTVRLDAGAYTRPETALVPPTDRTAREKAAYFLQMCGRCLRLIAQDVIGALFYGQPLT